MQASTVLESTQNILRPSSRSNKRYRHLIGKRNSTAILFAIDCMSCDKFSRDDHLPKSEQTFVQEAIDQTCELLKQAYKDSLCLHHTLEGCALLKKTACYSLSGHNDI